MTGLDFLKSYNLKVERHYNKATMLQTYRNTRTNNYQIDMHPTQTCHHSDNSQKALQTSTKNLKKVLLLKPMNLLPMVLFISMGYLS